MILRVFKSLYFCHYVPSVFLFVFYLGFGIAPHFYHVGEFLHTFIPSLVPQAEDQNLSIICNSSFSLTPLLRPIKTNCLLKLPNTSLLVCTATHYFHQLQFTIISHLNHCSNLCSHSCSLFLFSTSSQRDLYKTSFLCQNL